MRFYDNWNNSDPPFVYTERCMCNKHCFFLINFYKNPFSLFYELAVFSKILIFSIYKYKKQMFLN